MSGPGNQSVAASEPVRRVLDRLETAARNGSGWLARCPAHDDRSPSLSVAEGDDGRCLIRCHAGCPLPEVLAALSLSSRDLFLEAPNGAPAIAGPRVPEAVYPYLNEEGVLLFEVCRFPDKRFRQRCPDPKARGGYRWNLKGVRRVLYRLPQVLEVSAAGERIFVVEGEKDVEALERAGAHATCNPGGAGKWRPEYAEALRGAEVVIVADRDDPGRKHALAICESVTDVARLVRVVEAATGKDASDHLAGGAGLEDFTEGLDRLAAGIGQAEVDVSKTSPDAGAKSSHAKRLVDQALDGAEFFHTPAGDPFASVPVAGRRETMSLGSRAFSRWLGRMLHEEQIVAGSSAVKDALAALEGHALYAGAEHAVHTRLAPGDGDVIYIDLGDATWRAIEVTATGWRVIDDPPVKFRRSSGMRALSDPVPGGTMDELRAYINLPGDSQWTLLLSWAVAALLPTGPYPLLVLHGEQGTAKSTAAKLLRSLIDPAKPELRGEPDKIDNFMIAAKSNWLLAYDNLSAVKPWFSDALCRLSTGGGHAVRALYTDDEEALIDVQRPVILNGIEALTRRSDLLERALLIELPLIPPAARQSERDLFASFEPARGRMLGALLDGVVSVLANRTSVHLLELPRMADFAIHATAAEGGLGLKPGAFITAYQANRENTTGAGLEASPLWPLLCDLADGSPRQASELLSQLEERADNATKNRPGWPSAPHVLSGQIKRLAPNLREMGIDVDYGTRGRGNGRHKTITLTQKDPESTDPSDPSDPTALQSQISGSHGVAPPGVGSLVDRGGVAWGRSGSLTDGLEKPQDSGLGSLGSLGSLASLQEEVEESPDESEPPR